MASTKPSPSLRTKCLKPRRRISHCTRCRPLYLPCSWPVFGSCTLWVFGTADGRLRKVILHREMCLLPSLLS
ncbi:hypothetical protein F443_20906 [Phytophthora nicotianae P1569]|uniref:Uncharacterized protein n=1 Tax=Phytophthora nicotianae P1569 TaxID=1317065 RepID=V9DZE6_PHYNI|nr:hypothetical protein F443_20906 [Phytophthora nicotianae P1569]